MKFRDKDGNVFEDILDAWVKWCCVRDCSRACAINKASGGKYASYSCCEYCESHPAEAARLMGYEVVEDAEWTDDIVVGIQDGKPEVKKEANMDKQKPRICDRCGREFTEDCPQYLCPECDSALEEQCGRKQKPRICEVLGVEVEEEWAVGDTTYRINEKGQREFWYSGRWLAGCCETTLWDAINHPEKIIRKTRFTEEEVADARALKRILGATGVRRNKDGGSLVVVVEWEDKFVINRNLFPSIQPGQSVKLSEIAGGET